MRFTVRTAALLTAFLVLTSTAPADAVDPRITNPAAVDGEYSETFHVTLDWSNPQRVLLPPTSEYWGYEPLATEIRSYYQVGTTEGQGAGNQVYVETKYTPMPWQAPPHFEFTFWDAPYRQNSYRVVVDSVNIPEEPHAPDPSEIELPVIDDAVVTEDVGEMWDAGFPIADYTRDSGYVDIPVGQFMSGTRGDYRVTVKPLNDTMSTYFSTKATNGFADSRIELHRRPGSAPLPARYWAADWFRLDYTLTGDQEDDAGWGVVRHYSVDRSVVFQEPPHELVARSCSIRYQAQVGYTSTGECPPRPGEAYGLIGGTLRFEILDVPAKVSRHFKVLLSNPQVATESRGPRIGVRTLTKKSAVRVPRFTIIYRAGALDRAGDQIWSAPATYTFRASRR